MTLFQNLKDSAEQRPIQIEPIPPDLLTTEEKNWKNLTHHYEPLE